MVSDQWRDDLEAAVPAADEQGARALDAAQRWVGGPVSGVGLGAAADGARCVLVYADDSAGELPDLPDQVEGLPVLVERGDGFTAQADLTAQADDP